MSLPSIPLRCSLLKGSHKSGVYMHDIVRHFAIAGYSVYCAGAGEGGGDGSGDMKLRMTITAEITTGHFQEAKENGSSSPTSPRPPPIVATEGGGGNLRALQRAVVVALLLSRAKYMDIQNALNASTQHVQGRVGGGRDGSNTTQRGVARGRKNRIQRKGSNPFFADAGAAALTRNTSPWYVHHGFV